MMSDSLWHLVVRSSVLALLGAFSTGCSESGSGSRDSGGRGGSGSAAGGSGSGGTAIGSGGTAFATGGSAGNASGSGGALPQGGSSSVGGGGVGGDANAGSGGAGGSAAACGTYAWACWPMPNIPESALPHPATYTDLGDGTVRDDVTGLAWQKGVGPSTYTFSEAIDYCAGLDLAGGGFRLPRRIELLSIVDHAEFSPTVDETAFPDTPAGFFWTATPWAVSAEPPRSWIVNFADGLTSNNGFQTGAYSARCVRGGPIDGTTSADPPPDQYLVGGGEVVDRFTGLVWQQASSASAMTFAAAEDHCENLGLGGHVWRLPSVNELSTLVDERRVAPAIQIDIFPDTRPDDWYWSTTTYANNAANRWCLNHNDGYTTRGRAATESSYVRCVR